MYFIGKDLWKATEKKLITGYLWDGGMVTGQVRDDVGG